MKSLRFRLPTRRLRFHLSLWLILPALLLCWGVTASLGQDAAITVNAACFYGHINPLVFGHNVMFAANTMWDHRVDTLRSQLDGSGINVKSRIEGLGPIILRFPGGIASDRCLWEEGVGFRTTQPLTSASNEIVLDGTPQYWKTPKGLLIYSKSGDLAEYLDGQLGDAFNFTGVQGNKLTGVSLLNPPAAGYPAGVGIRSGGRPGQDSTDYWANTYGIIEHLKLVNSLGAEALLTVNYRTGLVSDGSVSTGATLDQRKKRAQALVAFVNGRTDDTRLLGKDADGLDWQTVAYWARKRAALGFPGPLDVRYWEVGNEIYDTSTDAATYAGDFIQFAQAMKDIDPKIRIGAVGLIDPERKYINKIDIWNPAVIAGAKNDLDLLAVHPYYPNANITEAGGDYKNDKWFTAVMAGATQALSDLRAIRGKIDANAPARKNQIGLAVTEYGFWLQSGGEAKYWSNLARALYDADLLMTLIKESLIDYGQAPLRLLGATSWNLHGQITSAAIGYNWATKARTIRPQYYALKMLRENLAGRRLVTTDVVSPTFVTEEVGNVPANLPVPRLAALAAIPNELPPAGQAALILAVLNRSPSVYDPAITATVTLNNYWGNSYKITTLTSASLADHNEYGEVVKPVSSGPFTPVPASFDFPPHSLTIIEFF